MKKSFLMFLSAAALVSCSESELNEPVDGSLISLKSVAYSAGASATRAPFVGAIGAGNALTALVPSSKTGEGVVGDYTNELHAEGTMTFNSTSAATYDLPSLGVGNEDLAKFPDGDIVHLFGAYPATGWTLAATGADFTFTGKEDVMGAKEVVTTKLGVSNNLIQTLVFNHLLTKLEVKFKAEATAVSAVGLIKSVKWIGDDIDGTTSLKNKVTFTAATGLAEFAAVLPSSVLSLPFYGVSETSGVKTYTDMAYENKTYELTTTSTLQAYAMVAPVTASAAVGTQKEYYLEVVRTIEGVDQTPDRIFFDLMKADGTPFSGSTAGNSFTVVVNYTSKDDIKAVATVTEWIENGEYISNVSGNY